MNTIIIRFRWKLFRMISAIGWAICPEPHRTNLLKIFYKEWEDIEHRLGILERAE